MKTKTILKTNDLTKIALFSALIIISSLISIPFTIPFTMQTFAVFLSLLILGGVKGSISIFIYIALGIFGLPVFAGFSSGISAIFGATGGFIIGFLLQGITYILLEKILPKTSFFTIVNLIVGQIVCYGCGALWFSRVYLNASDLKSLLSAFFICVVPYIIPDLLKLFLALSVFKVIKNYI